MLQNKSITILYDQQIFMWQGYGGISRYFYEVIRNIPTIDEQTTCILPLKYSNNHYLQGTTSSLGKVEPLINTEQLSENQNYLLQHFANKNYDIFHPTYYDPYFLDLLAGKPFVLTIYDMIHELIPAIFSELDKTSIQKKELAAKANKIIAISQNTKKDIMHILHIPEEKITVIPLGYSISKAMPINHSPLLAKIPKKYLLFVGDRWAYKNFRLFIESITSLLQEIPDLYLICAGGRKFTTDEISFIKNFNISQKILHCPINNELLAYLYQHAQAFIFPSLYEGFGLPILEAFACNCPVICSNTSSFPEVAGDAAAYFDPTDKISLLAATKKVLTDPLYRKELIKKGEQRLNLFSWKKTAEETMKVYRSLL